MERGNRYRVMRFAPVRAVEFMKDWHRINFHANLPHPQVHETGVTKALKGGLNLNLYSKLNAMILYTSGTTALPKGTAEFLRTNRYDKVLGTFVSGTMCAVTRGKSEFVSRNSAPQH